MFSKYKIELFLLIVFLAGLSPSSKYIEYVSIIYFLISLYAYFFFLNNNIDLVIHRGFYLPIIFFIFIIFQLVNLPGNLTQILSPTSFKFYEGLYQSDWYSIALNPIQSLKYLLTFLICFLIMIITPKLINKKRILKRVFEFVFWIGAAHALIALSIYFFDNKTLSTFVSLLRDTNYSFSGLFINRNNFSFYMVLFFIVAVNYYSFYFKYFSISKKTKFFNFILSDLFLIRAVIILFAITIVLTKSRAGNLSFLAVLIVLFLLDYYKNKKLTFITKTILTIIIIDVLLIGFFVGFDKVIERYAVTSATSEEYRLSFFEFGIANYFKFWLWGYGLGSFETLFRLEYLNFVTVADHVHNDFIEYLGELGLIGIALLFMMMVYYLFILNKSYQNKMLLSDIQNIVILTLVACVVHGNFDFALHKPAIIFFVIFNLSLGLCRLDKKTKTTSRSRSQTHSLKLH